MKGIHANTRRFLQTKRGANMVEYIILVGVVALLAVAGFGTFKGAVKKKISDQGTAVTNVETSEVSK